MLWNEWICWSIVIVFFVWLDQYVLDDCVHIFFCIFTRWVLVHVLLKIEAAINLELKFKYWFWEIIMDTHYIHSHNMFHHQTWRCKASILFSSLYYIYIYNITPSQLAPCRFFKAAAVVACNGKKGVPDFESFLCWLWENKHEIVSFLSLSTF